MSYASQKVVNSLERSLRMIVATAAHLTDTLVVAAPVAIWVVLSLATELAVHVGQVLDFYDALKKVTLGQPQKLGKVVSKEENSDIGSNNTCNVGENMEEKETLSVDRELVELSVQKEKAPRKIVSIKDEVDEIRISSRRIKRRTSKGSFSSFDEHEVMSLKPLKSILRKDSGVSKDP
ncbi:transmembrane protein [Arabidopsis thaliana]|uniref:Transmembrane protein n=1 Tax=Arabidopsis thaliana TaxID=3702 RepID=Q3ECM9_ARATH|nr:uncharacterized protein AT1G56555 [Arabidopsis thaliana]AEE33408.1 transmembrane protein [Arabidopsis thaliana]|eukprot:NP_683438.1 transmembrane protein [Arabidopsis thaliana]